MKITFLLLLCLALTYAQQPQFPFSQQGCLAFDENNLCILCKDRHYFLQPYNLCIPVSPLCKDYNPTNGQCSSCINGFTLNQGQCQVSLKPILPIRLGSTSATPPVSQINVNQLNCLNYNQNTSLCQKCNEKFVVLSGKCIREIINCQKYSPQENCEKCLDGFILNQSSCSQPRQPKLAILKPILDNRGNLTISCLLYNGTNSTKCLRCAPQFLLTNQSTCVRLSPLCLQYNSNGFCTLCDVNFTLSSGICVLKDSSNTSQKFDPLCARFNNTRCVRCSFGAYFNANRVCILGNPLCKEINNNGVCLSCFPSYVLRDGNCFTQTINLDPNCNTFEGIKCIRCSKGAAFDSNGRCIIMDPNCKQFFNGTCNSCYPGYITNDRGVCIIDSDFNCADWRNGKCNRCSQGYFLDGNRCKLIDPLCAKFDLISKRCTNCYMGYVLSNGACVDQRTLSPSNTDYYYCKQLDRTGKCISCYQREYIKDNVCVEVSQQCKTYHRQKGYCLSCYEGYELDQFGQCVINID